MKHLDTTLPVEERINSLLRQMSVDEKIYQLKNLNCPTERHSLKRDGDVRLTDELVEEIPKHGLLQNLLRSDFWSQKGLDNGFNRREAARVANMAQKVALEATRLKVPLLLTDNSRHGVCTIDSTIFPIGSAQGSSWNRSLTEKIGDAVGRELRSQGLHVSIGPHLNLARDPRFGRVEECISEDPILAGELGVSYINGLQRKDAQGYIQAAAAMIMYAGMGFSENGLDGRPVNVCQRDLLERLLAPFRSAVQKANVLAAMASYSSINGVPCHGNNDLINGQLKEEWGFQGFIESDSTGIHRLHGRHNVAASVLDACAMALNAGVDVDLYSNDGAYEHQLRQALDQSLVSIEAVDESVRRVLRVKFLLGLFENPYVDEGVAEISARNPEHQQLAKQAARESIVLLENKNNILPLDKTRYKSIALIGPFADDIDNVLGDYHAPLRDSNTVTMLDALRTTLGDGVRINYSRGYGVKQPKDEQLFNEALDAVKASELAIITIGGSSKREYSHKGSAVGSGIITDAVMDSDIDTGEGFDRVTLQLLGAQNEFIDAARQVGIPLVIVFVHGRAMCIENAANKSDALLDVFFPGERGPEAIIDCIFGEFSPSGRLPVTLPRHEGQLPCYYNTLRPARKHCIDMTSVPLYAFGYGLSYTSFAYTNLALSKDEIGIDEASTVSFDLENSGNMDAYEVVQVYIRDEYSSVVRPMLELKCFDKVFLKSKERRRLSFDIGPEQLAFYDQDMNYTVEPGDFTIMVGNNPDQLQSISLKVR